jgi:hypothetical protein
MRPIPEGRHPVSPALNSARRRLRASIRIAVMKANARNDHDAADILCAVCRFIVATLHADAPSSV